MDIGSISHGTLRPQDLSQSILDHWSSYLDKNIIDDLETIATGERGEDPTDWEVINDALDMVWENTPPYCYAGFHPDDGSDLGVWVDWDLIEHDIHDGYLMKISDLSEAPTREQAKGVGFLLLVNDHGNCTLCCVDFSEPEGIKEVWSVV
jgi:hypothetical protein